MSLRDMVRISICAWSFREADADVYPGKHGELLINYEETEEHRARQASVISNGAEKNRAMGVENVHHANPDYAAEQGYRSKQ